MNIRISADSTCDLSPELVRENGVTITPLYIVCGEKSLVDGVDIAPDDVFAWTREHKKPCSTAAVNVAAAVKPEAERSFAEVKAAVEEALRRHFTGTLLGKGVFLAELGSLIYQVDGVANCRLTAPAADLAAVPTALPVLGTVTITEMEG